MRKKIWKSLTDNCIIGYGIILALITCGFVYSRANLLRILPFALILIIASIMMYALEYYLILKAEKIQASFKRVHNIVVAVWMFKVIFSLLIDIVMQNYPTIITVIKDIIEILFVLFITYILRKEYDLSKKKTVILASSALAIEFIFIAISLYINTII